MCGGARPPNAMVVFSRAGRGLASQLPLPRGIARVDALSSSMTATGSSKRKWWSKTRSISWCGPSMKASVDVAAFSMATPLDTRRSRSAICQGVLDETRRQALLDRQMAKTSDRARKVPSLMRDAWESATSDPDPLAALAAARAHRAALRLGDTAGNGGSGGRCDMGGDRQLGGRKSAGRVGALPSRRC